MRSQIFVQRLGIGHFQFAIVAACTECRIVVAALQQVGVGSDDHQIVVSDRPAVDGEVHDADGGLNPCMLVAVSVGIPECACGATISALDVPVSHIRGDAEPSVFQFTVIVAMKLLGEHRLESESGEGFVRGVELEGHQTVDLTNRDLAVLVHIQLFGSQAAIV